MLRIIGDALLEQLCTLVKKRSNGRYSAPLTWKLERACKVTA